MKSFILISLWVVIELIYFPFISCIQNYDVVYSKKDQKYYVIKDNYYHEISGQKTIDLMLSGLKAEKLGYKGRPISYPHKIDDIKSLKNYIKGDSYPSLLTYDNNKITLNKTDNELCIYNNNILNYIFYNNISLLYDIYDIPYDLLDLITLKNSAIVPIDNKYLGINPKKFYWLNHNFKIDLSIPLPTFSMKFTNIEEDDHRLHLLSNGDILIIFTAFLDHHNGNVDKPGIRFLKKSILLNGESNYTLTDQIVLYHDDIKSNLESGYEKNWSPFNYNKQLYFIQSFQPFKIYKLEKKSKNNFLIEKYKHITYQAQSVRLISEIKCLEFSSYFGEIRGGTPAMLIRGQYLAFYHTFDRFCMISSDIYPGNYFCYFIGGYTFSSNPPFTITSMSRFPITHELFIPTYIKRIYTHGLVTFAMSYVLIDQDGNVILEGQKEEEPDKTTVVITIGLGDSHTIIAKINLNELYNSFKPVDCTNEL